MLLRQLFESQQNKTAVLGWGRGMGHKGHMLLAKAVLHHAQENNAKPYFVVSRTSLVDPSTGQPWTDRPTFTKTKDDPLTPDEKLNTYRKVFPQNAEVFSVATADATKLEQVMAKIAREGFNKVILVVGEDQKASMGYLTRPDKSGVPPYQQAGLNDLEIISRQDTTEPSSMRGSPEYQEGPRATPMRQVLLDPSKSEEEQFAVWRRDMPDNLSDEEVMDLMLKAKQRMSMEPAAKKPAKKGVAEEFGPLPKDNQQIRLGRHTVDIERVGLDKDYIGFAWHDSQGQEHYEEVQVGDLGSYDDLIKKIKQEISYQERQYTDQGVAEGSEDEGSWDQGWDDGYNGYSYRNQFPKDSVEYKDYLEGFRDGRLKFEKKGNDSDFYVPRPVKKQDVAEGSEWETRHDEFVTVGDRATPEQINKIVSALGVAAKQASSKRGFLNQIVGKQSNGDLARMAHGAETLAKNIQRNRNAKLGTDERKELGQQLVYAVSLLKRMNGEQGVAELSDKTKDAYKAAAQAQIKDLEPWTKKGEYKDLAKNAIARRQRGLDRLDKRLVPVSEDVEQIMTLLVEQLKNK